MAPVLSSLISLLSPRSTAAWSVKTVAERVASFRQARANRRAFSALAGWDDHMLADIGLNRSAVQGALEVGFADDPSQVVTAESARLPVTQIDVPQPRKPQPMPAGCWAY